LFSGAEMQKDIISQKIRSFFHANSLKESFLEELLDTIFELYEHPMLLEENIFMLCHQYDFLYPEKIIKLIGGDTTFIKTDTTKDFVVQRELGGFRDDSLLGIGGMGEVRRVFDEDLQCFVAMKILHERLSEQDVHCHVFHHEARILAARQQPNIPPIHRYGFLEDGRPYFIMREIEGRPLSEVVFMYHKTKQDGGSETKEGVTFRRLIDIFKSICAAIRYAHHKDVIHRDLKPSNIMIGDFSQFLVVDWGLAKKLEDVIDVEGQVKKMVMQEAIEGTPAYMCLEQAKGDSLDVRSDIYALGAILYEILLGKRPYEGRDVTEVLE